MQPSISGPVTGGTKGWTFGTPDPAAIERRGYVMEEYFLDGVARRYRARAGSPPEDSGRWDVEPAETASYATRLYVVRPADPARFNGVLLANWQNVTVGIDLGFPSGEEIFRGYAWAGITAQKIGVDGITGQTAGLKEWDPERYGSLQHPGDAFSYDIFAQAARLLAHGGTQGSVDPMCGLRPKTLIAHGSSQSAMRLGSYINIAHPYDRLFDGFFLTAHWGLCPPVEDNSLMEQFAPAAKGRRAASSRIHDRGDTPILVLSSETEALDNFPVRQPDTDTFRFWEVAGGAHAPTVGAEHIGAIVTRDGAARWLSPAPHPNLVPYDYVRDAGLRALTRWIRQGRPPLRLSPIDIVVGPDGMPGFQRDANGNVTGGLRLPEVAVATGTHKGSNDGEPWQQLQGESLLFDRQTMLRLHGDQDCFLKSWDGVVDRLVNYDLATPDDAEVIRRRGRTAWDQLTS